MNILVTGSNGQLGNEMRALAAKGSVHTYLFTDVAELDITDAEAVLSYVKDEAVDVLVNCAAYTNVDKAEDDVALATLINETASRNLAVACKAVGATLIQVSTDYVFSGEKNTPCVETDATNPLGVYGRTKLAGEQAIEATGCKYLIFRTAWLYSAFGGNFVKTMLRLFADRAELKVVFDQVGTPTHAGDLAALIFQSVETGTYADCSGVYHFSNEGVCSWYDFARAIAELSGSACEVLPCHSDEFPSKVTRPSFSVLDKTKVKSDFNYAVPYWRESLKVCMQELGALK